MLFLPWACLICSLTVLVAVAANLVEEVDMLSAPSASVAVLKAVAANLMAEADACSVPLA